MFVFRRVTNTKKVTEKMIFGLRWFLFGQDFSRSVSLKLADFLDKISFFKRVVAAVCPVVQSKLVQICPLLESHDTMSKKSVGRRQIFVGHLDKITLVHKLVLSLSEFVQLCRHFVQAKSKDGQVKIHLEKTNQVGISAGDIQSPSITFNLLYRE